MLFVIGLTGLAGSGKSEVYKYIVDKYGFTKFVFSDVVREEAEKRNLLKDKTYEEQKLALSKLGADMRKESGRMDILAVKLVERIKSGGFEKVVVDGFRSVEEVVLFRENFENFYLVMVDTDEETKFLRRKKEDPTTTMENIRTRDKRDIEELGMEKVLTMADFRIDNNESIEALHEELDEMMDSIG